MLRAPRSPRRTCLALLALALCGCTERYLSEQQPGGRSGAQPPPRHRADGERMPAFTGRDPAARGWVKVDGLFWIEGQDLEAYRAGRVFDGTSYVPVGQALPAGVPADRGFRLRTDHVTLRTNLSWACAQSVAREAEGHVVRLMTTYGEALDLRLPEDPLPLVVSARRAEFERTLRHLVEDPVTWGAFYDARAGVVYTCAQPAERGCLPWVADLRHEMTHQILDLSRPPGRRAQTVEPPWFWLWEGFAVWSEGLGDPHGADSGAQRVARFRMRRAWNDWTPLDQLFRCDQRCFEGRHYDQVDSLMRYLMDRRVPDRRAAMLDVVRRMLAGTLADGDLERAVGVPVAVLEGRWLATVGR